MNATSGPAPAGQMPPAGVSPSDAPTSGATNSGATTARATRSGATGSGTTGSGAGPTRASGVLRRPLRGLSNGAGRVAHILGGVLPTTRLCVLVGLGALFWVMTALLPSWAVVPWVYNVSLLFFALLDLLISPRPRELELERTSEDKLNLGMPNLVELRVRNGARFPATVTVRDEPPLRWPVQNHEPPLWRDGTLLPPLPRVTVTVAPRGEVAANYRVTPIRRGDFEFGVLTARYATLLGFWMRQFSRRVADNHVRVYPDTTEVRRYELALREHRLQNSGLHLLRLRGRGTEFESLREYTRGDEYRSIDWKASARRGKLIATNYEIERDQSVIICLDCGRMMTSMAVSRPVKARPGSAGVASGAGGTLGGTGETGGSAPVGFANAASGAQTPGAQAGDAAADGAADAAGSALTGALEWPVPEETPLSKLDCAINATVLLAHVAASMGDAVGLLLFSDNVLQFIPPRKGKVQTGLIIEALYSAQPSLVEPDYQAAYEHLMARKLRRSLVVTFTDIIDREASEELLTASAALRRHHNPLCVTINNRDVMDMAAQVPHLPAELYQKAMASQMLSERGAALERLKAHGVGILDVEARELTVSTVNRYLDLKSRGAL